MLNGVNKIVSYRIVEGPGFNSWEHPVDSVTNEYQPLLTSLVGDGRIVLVHLYIEVDVNKDIRL